MCDLFHLPQSIRTVTITKYVGIVAHLGLETEKTNRRLQRTWITGSTVQIVNHYTIKHHLSSIFAQPVYYDWATLYCTAGFVLSHVVVVVSDSINTTACLIWHCKKYFKSFSLSQQIRAPPPLLSSSTPNTMWVREYVSTHLFDRSTWTGWWEICRVTIGLLVGATSNNISERKLVT